MLARYQQICDGTEACGHANVIFSRLDAAMTALAALRQQTDVVFAVLTERRVS